MLNRLAVRQPYFVALAKQMVLFFAAWRLHTVVASWFLWSGSVGLLQVYAGFYI